MQWLYDEDSTVIVMIDRATNQGLLFWSLFEFSLTRRPDVIKLFLSTILYSKSYSVLQIVLRVSRL